VRYTATLAGRDEQFTTRLGSAPRKDRRGVNLISDVLPFGRLWYGEPKAVSNAVEYAKFYSRSHDAVISTLLLDHLGTPCPRHLELAGAPQRFRSPS
jgi:hypothetical protein